MNDFEETELRKLIVYRIANSHPDTFLEFDINKDIIENIDYSEAKALIGDYFSELSILANEFMNGKVECLNWRKKDAKN